MTINGEYYDSYNDWCEETLKYMQCQKESFDFGEGEMSMSDSGGEHATYKFSILHYLNSISDDDYASWYKEQFRNKLNAKLEVKFDELSSDKLSQKLHNRYDINMKYRARRTFNAKYKYHEYYRYPYYTKFDENGNEYLVYSNYTNKKDKEWTKNKRKSDNPNTRSYQLYCEYCEKEIVYDEETLCDSCYSNFEAEGVFVFERQKENEIMWNNDFSEYKVKDGHWWFHDYYDWEEKRWNILHMKLN